MNPTGQEADPPDSGKQTPEHTGNKRPHSTWGEIVMAIFVGATVIIYIVLVSISVTTMRVDQRAWISIPFPNSFPLNGTSIPIVIQIINSGKTPAKGLVVDIIASVFDKSDKPTVGDFSIGHPHERLHAPGVIFPHDPVPVNISVGTYLPEGGEKPTVPDDALRQDMAGGERYILFYGRATYHDVFGIQHFTQFCTGSGSGIPSDILKDCLTYNDVDSSQE
jgi:hypothetical protein